MSELRPQRHYSPAAQKVMETFTANQQERDELEQRGLIATNNLCYRMQIFERGPDDDLAAAMYHALLSPRSRELLVAARQHNPQLWQRTLTVNADCARLSAHYFDALRTHGRSAPQAHEIAVQLKELEQQDVELRSRVFDIIDQQLLTPEEALDLCR